jgi:hypothetical protein
MRKAEDDGLFPQRAYALVTDKDKPATWKMRLWESFELGITQKQLDRLRELLGVSLIPKLCPLTDKEFLVVANRIRIESERLSD